MRLIKLLFFAFVFVSTKVIANSEPIIYNNDNSYWVPKAEITPTYPIDAIKFSRTGCVRVEFGINSEGKTVEPYQVISIPEKTFEKVSLGAVKKASFIPSNTNINRVAVRSSIVYAFNLHSQRNNEYFSLEQCEKLTSK